MKRTGLFGRGALLAASFGLALTAGSGVAEADSIKIGAPFNVTGSLSSLDAPALNGAKLKAKEINAAGGVNGKTIELVVYDTKTDPTVIASVASQLLNSDKVPVAMGFTDSDSALALGPIFQQAGVPFVTPGATSPKLPEQVGTDMFLACFGDNVQAAAGAEFVLNKLNGKNAYLLRDNSTEYTTLLAKYFDKDGIKSVLLAEHVGGFVEKMNTVMDAFGYKVTLDIEPDFIFLVTDATGVTTPAKELSGSEQLMWLVALQCAVSKAAGIGIVVADRLDTFLPSQRAKVNKVLYTLTQNGTLDQVVAIMSDESEMVPKLPNSAFFMVEAGTVRRLQ